jgi:hypothetical protein
VGNLVSPQGCSIFRRSSFYCTAVIEHDYGKRFQFKIASMRKRFSDDGLCD